jgi:hypothetical protein
MVKKPLYILLIQLPLTLVIIGEGIRTKYLQDLQNPVNLSMGYFYGCKLHATINHKREFMALKMTIGNV